MPASRRLATAALALAPFAFALPAAAQDGQPVRLIVGYAAGGPVDQGARLFAPALSKELGIDALASSTPSTRFRSFHTSWRFLAQEIYFFHRDLFAGGA